MNKLTKMAGVTLTGLTLGSMAAEERKPNVVMIFTDDHGTLDVNCFGAKDLYTPNLDKLAANGLKLTQFYVGAAVCSPSRAALLTGRYPQRAQLEGNVPRSGKGGLPPRQITIAEEMKKNGYKTALVGKWHLGEHETTSPNAQGFDYFFGHRAGCIDNYSHFFYWDGPQNHDLWRNTERTHEDGKYFPDLCVKEAGQFMEENKDKPFFLYLAMNTPHYPMQPEQRFMKKYEGVKEPRKTYAAFVSTLDDKIGKVVAKIDELGLSEDTIIVFSGDHGHSTEGRCGGGGGYTGPFQGNKFNNYEGGIRVPAIISWPGTIKAGETRNQMITSLDWMPTLAKMCGNSPIKHRIDGKDSSLVLLNDEKSAHKEFFWKLGGSWAVRKGDWKLLRRHNGDMILSDLSKDVREKHDLSAKFPAVRKELESMYENWLKECKNQN